MWWFVGGYLLIAAAFYSYIVVTAQEEPEEAHEALGQTPAKTLTGARHSSNHPGHEKLERRKPRAA